MSIGGLVAVPELASEGIARLIGEQPGFWKLRFLASSAESTQETHSVVRYCLLPGSRIQVKVREDVRVGTILPTAIARDRTSGLLVYRVEWAAGGTAQVREDGITGVIEESDPVVRLATVAFHDLRPIRSGRGGAAPKLEPWGPIACSARERLLEWRDAVLAATGGVSALASARIVPLPHQVHAARRVLADREVRFLLSDEVGLGKTIEAGLILQSLASLGGADRVLIVAPGALASQWFVEMHVRFGARGVTVIDGERLRTLDGNPWIQHSHIIVSMKALEDLDAKAAMQFATAKWDVLIVDECHRLQGGSLLAKRLAMASKATRHVLLLSATPGRSDPMAWLNLLHLLHPTSWRLDQVDAVATRLAQREAMATLAAATQTASSKKEMAALLTQWRPLLIGDASGLALVDSLATADNIDTAREALLTHVREHHDPDRRIVRRTRADLLRLGTALPGLSLATRELRLHSYHPDADEQAVQAAFAAYARFCIDQHGTPPRLVHWLLSLHLATAHPAVLRRLVALRQAVIDDPETAATYSARIAADEGLAQVIRPDLSEGEVATHLATSAACHADADELPLLAALQDAAENWNARAARKSTPRLRALIAALETFWAERPDEKVLVFTANPIAIEPLRAAFAAALGEEAVATFGAHQDVLAREEAARRFATVRACTVLICDPLGGEGRNFQFASLVAHHDLPWSVAAIEQRIGRIDRLGRDGVVDSLVLRPDDDGIDAAWTDLVQAATAVFERPSGGLEFALDAFESQALLAALAPAGASIAGGAGIRAVAPALTALLAKERASADRRDDAALVAAGEDLARSAKLAERLAAVEAPGEALGWWIRAQGGKAKREDEAPYAWRLRPPRSDAIERGTTDRATALAHHDLAFLAPGNALVDELLRDAYSSRWATATAWRRGPGDGCQRWEGLRAVFVLTPDLNALSAAGLPLDAARRLWLTLPLRREIMFVRREDLALEEDPAVLAHLRKPFDHRSQDRAISVGGAREAWTRPWAAGQVDQITAWQDGVYKTAAAARAAGEQAFAVDRAECALRLDEELAALAAATTAAAERLAQTVGENHPDTVVARREAAAASTERTALLKALADATVALESAAWMVVG